MRHRVLARAASAVLVVLPFTGCGDDQAGETTLAGGAGGPAPTAMCTAPLVPVAASYDLETGAYQWHVCGDPEPWYSAEAVTDDTLYVTAQLNSPSPIVIALDARTGTERWRGDLKRMEQEVPKGAARPMSEPPTIDGVTLAGGQDDPLIATDASTGAELWRHEEHLPYDDVWAVGDGAIYVTRDGSEAQPTSSVVAYDLRTGATRWERPVATAFWGPMLWWVDAERLFALQTDVIVMSTRDGSILWRTEYPVVDQMPSLRQPTMRGVLANDRSVFVSFASRYSGGD